MIPSNIAAPSCLYRRVERTLAINRDARLAFPSVFIPLSGQRTADDRVRVTFHDDPAFRDGRGELDWCVLCALLDVALGTASDIRTGPKVRPATAHIELQMTGAPTRGDIVFESGFAGSCETSRVRQSLITEVIKSGETLIARVSAACVLLDLPEGVERKQWPWLPAGFPEPGEAVTFDPDELRALEFCARAEAAATQPHPFIEHFWCGIPERQEGGASLQVPVTPHLGNRIGHVQGGLLLGTAVKVANAAAPETMRLSNISAYFVSPGLGPVLDVHSEVMQQGRKLALVRTRINGPSGKRVLETVSQHAAI